MITYGSAILYTSFDKQAQTRLPLRLPTVIEEVTKKEIPNYKRFLSIGVSGTTKDGVDCILPDVRYQI
jgi:hypothetical protein